MSINEIKPGEAKTRWWIQLQGVSPDFHDASNLVIYRDGPCLAFTTKGGVECFSSYPYLIRQERRGAEEAV